MQHPHSTPIGRAGAGAYTRARHWLSIGALVGLAGLSGLTSCGSRTGLFTPDPCEEEGREEPCQGICGSGVVRCENGFWSTCVVPEQRRPCNNACGTGIQACVDESFGPCEVDPVTEECDGPCGHGSRTCSNGAWEKCEVAPTSMPCKNTCGEGAQRCEDGVFGSCVVNPVAVPCESACGSGFERCEDGAWKPCDAPLPNPPRLETTVRDFHISHPDFEMATGAGSEKGIVFDDLGPDDKPVYRGGDRVVHSTTSKESFDQWYRDVPGVNWPTSIPLQLEPLPGRPGFFRYTNNRFFPIDDQLFGNEGLPHNYHFTLEAHATFKYVGGEVFSFTGDDDMWVFINRRLAIDLGGLHQPLSATVSLDGLQGSHDITPGGVYPLDFFFAERHTIESNFTIETSIADQGSCP